jgi:hypothetical protein
MHHVRDARTARVVDVHGPPRDDQSRGDRRKTMALEEQDLQTIG